MPTRNVVITDHQAALIERLVESGRYQNASEVLRTGLRLLELQEEGEAARMKAFDDAIAEGEAAYARGDYIVLRSKEDIDAFMKDLATAT